MACTHSCWVSRWILLGIRLGTRTHVRRETRRLHKQCSYLQRYHNLSKLGCKDRNAHSPNCRNGRLSIQLRMYPLAWMVSHHLYLLCPSSNLSKFLGHFQDRSCMDSCNQNWLRDHFRLYRCSSRIAHYQSWKLSSRKSLWFHLCKDFWGRWYQSKSLNQLWEYKVLLSE